jgi:hypothetical protein
VTDPRHLRIVDSDNVRQLPVGNLRDIAAAARGFADAVEAGSIDVDRCIIVAIVDGALDYSAWGNPPCIVEAIGMLEMASRKIERDGQ